MTGPQNERGASLVEFAFVLPIMMAFVMGLVTYGLTEAGDNTASSAAREGARVGILQYESADIPGTNAQEAIVDAVERHMGSGFVTNSSVAVRCVRPATNGVVPEPSAADSCAEGHVDVGRDLIEVTVRWDPIGPVDRPQRTEFARMTIIGRPILSETDVEAPIDTDPNDEIPPEYQPPDGGDDGDTVTTPPEDCVIEAVTISPHPVRVVTTQGKLHEDVIYRAQTNGALNCGEITFHWGSGTHDEPVTVLTPAPADHTFIGALPKNSGSWTTGNTKTVTARNSLNEAELVHTFSAVPHNS